MALPDIVAEAERILARAGADEVPVRLVGGLAIRLHADGPIPDGLRREFKDIDLVTRRKAAKRVGEMLEELGYQADRNFNAMNAGRRALYWDVPQERQVDVFIDSFDMCHDLPIAARLELDSRTVPLAELLLTKLQIVKLNEKDLGDILALLVEHEVGSGDADTINADFVAELCAADWGLWRTTTMNIERAEDGLDDFALADSERDLIRARLATLAARVESQPKTRKWKMRQRVGDRVRWYQEPEEVDDDV